jgi:hypothetical protein
MPFVGNRDFAVKVVGESFYNYNLRELCGPAEDHMRQFAKTAILTLENDNPYDRNAVRVDIDGLTVGHLSRSDATRFRAACAGQRTEHFPCSALLISLRGNALLITAFDLICTFDRPWLVGRRYSSARVPSAQHSSLARRPGFPRERDTSLLGFPPIAAEKNFVRVDRDHGVTPSVCGGHSQVTDLKRHRIERGSRIILQRRSQVLMPLEISAKAGSNRFIPTDALASHQGKTIAVNSSSICRLISNLREQVSSESARHRDAIWCGIKGLRADTEERKCGPMPTGAS